MQKSGFDHYHTRQSPDDVRFTKPTIDLNFPGQHEFENIYDVLRALELKILQPRSLPSLRVFFQDNQLWTIDNKLLYIYRISPKVRRVSITFISGIKFIDRFLNENSKSDMERMASPDFFPEVVRTSASHAMQSSSSQDSVLLPTMAGFKKMEKERISAGKAHSSASLKSSRSSSSSKTAASHISSDDNVESNLTAGTETYSPARKSLRTCTVRNENSVDSSTNSSSVKSYPVYGSNSNNCSSHKERNPEYSSNGRIRPPGETTSERGGGQSTLESKVRDLYSTTVEKDEQQRQLQLPPQPPPSSRYSPVMTRVVVECRDIPVSNTLAPVHTLTESANNHLCWDSAAECSPAESKPNSSLLQFRSRGPEIPVGSCPDSPEELSKWRELDTLDAPAELVGRFSAKSIMMNQVSSNNKTVSEASERGQYQQHQHLLSRAPLSSPSKRGPAESESHYSSDNSSKDRQSRLDRPLSSCGSSAPPVLERPSTCNFPLDPRKDGPLFRLCTTSTAQADRGNQSPPRNRTRAFLSAEKKSQGKLSREHELEVSKKILLKHMKKAFFSVY